MHDINILVEASIFLLGISWSDILSVSLNSGILERVLKPIRNYNDERNFRRYSKLEGNI